MAYFKKEGGRDSRGGDRKSSSRSFSSGKSFSKSWGDDKKGGDRGGRDDRNGGIKNDGDRRSFGRDRSTSMHKAVCSECKNSCEVPFRPSTDKPIFCDNCFAGKRDNSRDYGRDTYATKENKSYSDKSFVKDNARDNSSQEIKRELVNISTTIKILSEKVDSLFAENLKFKKEINEMISSLSVKSVNKEVSEKRIEKKPEVKKVEKTVTTKKTPAKKVVEKKVEVKKPEVKKVEKTVTTKKTPAKKVVEKKAVKAPVKKK